MNNKIIQIKCTGTSEVDIKRLINFQGNLKTLMEEQYLKLRNSIEKYGFRVPIFVWRNNIIDGHQRIFTINKMIEDGWTAGKIPIVELQAENEKEAKKLLLLINSRYGKISDDGLYEFLENTDISLDDIPELDLPEIDMDKFLNEFYVDETEGDDELPEEVKSVCKRGDLYQLNNHRLLCGDSTLKSDVDRLMNSKKADMVFTDPPYGINLDTDYSKYKTNLRFIKEKNIKGGKKYNKVINDDKPFNPKHIFDNFGYCKEMFLWGAEFYSYLLPDKSISGTWFCWDKRIDSQADKMYGGHFELLWSKQRHQRQLIRKKWVGVFGTETQDIHKRLHPTQKPIEVLEWIINKYTKESNIIIDLYLGSGSTLIACEKTNRICYGIEIDENYCDIIIQRYRDFCDKNNIKCEIKKLPKSKRCST